LVMGGSKNDRIQHSEEKGTERGRSRREQRSVRQRKVRGRVWGFVSEKGGGSEDKLWDTHETAKTTEEEKEERALTKL